MGLDAKYGWAIFFGVPIVLWFIGAGAALRKGRQSPLLAYLGGSDNRLSLSRLQAFLWTLVIFGAFAAAMAIHTKIVSAPQAEIDQAKADIQRASDVLKRAKDVAATGTENERANAAKTVSDAEAALKAAEANATKYDWVNIPAALLALAGIAIGSGVFSSLIAASNSEEKTACVTSVQANPIPSPAGGEAVIATLLINGRELGSRGRVRFGREPASIRNWKDDGTQIQVDLPSPNARGPLVVDTSHGKLAYELIGTAPNFTLGQPVSYYEFVDLFRDDKNPDILDLMKFQMFGWTVVAILIYVYLFLTQLRPDLTELPNVPTSIALLTGISQSGYLAGKGISNIK